MELGELKAFCRITRKELKKNLIIIKHVKKVLMTGYLVWLLILFASIILSDCLKVNEECTVATVTWNNFFIFSNECLS